MVHQGHKGGITKLGASDFYNTTSNEFQAYPGPGLSLSRFVMNPPLRPPFACQRPAGTAGQGARELLPLPTAASPRQQWLLVAGLNARGALPLEELAGLIRADPASRLPVFYTLASRSVGRKGLGLGKA